MTDLFDQSSIEAIARALGHTDDGLTNAEIDSISQECRICVPEPGTKWERVFNAMARAQNESQKRTGILAFIRKSLKPSRHLRDPNRFESMRYRVNTALAFNGLQIGADGKLQSVGSVSTISEASQRANELRSSLLNRGVHHDVLKFCNEELLADDHFHAVLEATKSIAQKLRDLSGLTGDGAQLVDDVLSGSDPVLLINSFLTESEKSEQKGFATMCKGIFGTFRNPAAHAPRISWSMSKTDAEDLMSILSLMHRRLDSARKR